MVSPKKKPRELSKDNTQGKPHILDILARRRKTTADFLENNGIKTAEDFKLFLEQLSKEYAVDGWEFSCPPPPTSEEKVLAGLILGIEEEEDARILNALEEADRSAIPKKNTKKSNKQSV